MFSRLRFLLIALFLLGSRFSPAHAAGKSGDVQWQTIIAEHQQIRFPFAAPKTVDKQTPLPLLLLLHGETGKRAENVLRQSHWADTADRVGLLVAAVGPDCTSPAHLSALLRSIGNTYSIDTHRIYAARIGVGETLWNSLAPEWKARGIVAFAAPLNRASSSFALWQQMERAPGAVTTTAVPATAAPGSTRLLIQITGIRNDDGKVSVLLFHAADGFPGDARKAVAQQELSLDRKTPRTIIFPALPPGDYAAVLLHDENSNGKMDTSFGFPLEGFGTSNNPRVRMGPPSFNEARIFLSGHSAERTIFIRMVYL